MKKLLVVVLGLLGLSFSSALAGVSGQVIYGPDDRLDWFEAPRGKVDWARSTAVLATSKEFVRSGSRYQIDSPTYAEAEKLCPGSRFGDQLNPGFCSGFLVGEDLLLTAGHCIDDLADCKKTLFVFDYALMIAGQQPREVSDEQVFFCRDLVARANFGVSDYALIRLDRPTGRPGLKIRRAGAPPIGSGVTLIGHPVGLPSKISPGGAILGNKGLLRASVDAFGGNSGSAVVDSLTGEVQGILVSGESDFDHGPQCKRERVCGPNCRGEDLFPVAQIEELIPATP